MKKGFTLVELAIVLVIIGLIMGMAIKGKALIDVAKVRAELAKVTQIQASTAAYVAKNNGRLPESMDNLTNAALITAKDITSQMAGDKKYRITRCAAGTNVYAASTTGNDVCVIGATDADFSKRIACHVEVTLDDEDVTTGLGRNYGSTATGIVTADYEDCDKLSNNAGYAYVVF